MEFSELKTLPQWIGWKKIKRKGRIVKLPVNPHNGRAASSTNPGTWTTADKAWRVKKKYKLEGLGFVFTKETGVVGVDLDDCFIDGYLKNEASQVVKCLNSYTEYSPSGNGLHVFVQGDIPKAIKEDSRGFEMYNTGRYFTVTGQEYGASEFVNSTIEGRQKELLALFVVYGGNLNDKPLPSIAKKTYTDLTMDRVRRALSFIPPVMDYDDWLKILMSVHSEYPDSDGVSLIESWSPGFAGEVEAKFKSFKRSDITINTLFYYARQHGYTLPPSGDEL